MKTNLMLAALVLAAGCEPTTLQDNRREIHKEERKDGLVPMRALDEALQTEGQRAERAIFGQLQMLYTKSYSNDINRFSREMSGPLNASKLQKLGITEDQLKGQYYKASDYNLSFKGKEVTITASYPNTRGYTSNPFTLR